MLSYALTNATTFLYHAQSKCLSCIFLSILKSNLAVIPNKNSVATTARLFVCLPHCWEVLIGLNLSSALPIWRLHVLRHSHAFQKHSRYMFCLSVMCPAIDWRPVEGVPGLSPKGSWVDSSSPGMTAKKRKKGCILILLVLFGIRYFKLYCKKIWSVYDQSKPFTTTLKRKMITCVSRVISDTKLYHRRSPGCRLHLQPPEKVDFLHCQQSSTWLKKKKNCKTLKGLRRDGVLQRMHMGEYEALAQFVK